MVDSDKDHDRSMRPGAEYWDGHTGPLLSDQMIRRSGDTVCGLHCARGDEEGGFLG
jgi:hypothetical protein